MRVKCIELSCDGCIFKTKRAGSDAEIKTRPSLLLLLLMLLNNAADVDAAAAAAAAAADNIT